MKKILIGLALGIMAYYYLHPLLMRAHEKGIQEPQSVWEKNSSVVPIDVSALVPPHQVVILYIPVPPRKILSPYKWKYELKLEKDQEGNEIKREYKLLSTPGDRERVSEERENEEFGARSEIRGGETWVIFYLENLSKDSTSRPLWDLKIQKGFRGPWVFEVERSISLEPGERKRVEVDITPYVVKNSYYQAQVSIMERAFSGCVINGSEL